MDTPHNPAGAVMEPNQLLDMAAFKKLEKMPTKLEMIATIARLLNQVGNMEHHVNVFTFVCHHCTVWRMPCIAENAVSIATDCT